MVLILQESMSHQRTMLETSWKTTRSHEQANFVNGEGSLQGTRSSNNRELGEFNKEVIKRLRKLLGSLEKPIGMCSFA